METKMQTTVTNNLLISQLASGLNVPEGLIRSINGKIRTRMYENMQNGASTIEEALKVDEKTTERPRIQPVFGQKLCMDCWREAKALNMSDEDARVYASHEETDFVKIGKVDGIQKYGSYCVQHNTVRATANKQKKDAEKRVKRLPQLIEKRQVRIAELTAQLQFEQEKLDQLLVEIKSS